MPSIDSLSSTVTTISTESLEKIPKVKNLKIESAVLVSAFLISTLVILGGSISLPTGSLKSILYVLPALSVTLIYTVC